MSLCDTYLDEITAAYNSAAWVQSFFLEYEVGWFKDNYMSHTTFNSTWRTHIKSFVVNVNAILEELIYCNVLSAQPERIPYYLEHCIEAGDVTIDMAAILNAMIAADFPDLQRFIGIVDAYRVALWGEPFNAEYYAALARGFRP